MGLNRRPKHVAVVVNDDRARASGPYVYTEDRNDSPFMLSVADVRLWRVDSTSESRPM
jgi:hypothetical protein